VEATAGGGATAGCAAGAWTTGGLTAGAWAAGAWVGASAAAVWVREALAHPLASWHTQCPCIPRRLSDVQAERPTETRAITGHTENRIGDVPFCKRQLGLGWRLRQGADSPPGPVTSGGRPGRQPIISEPQQIRGRSAPARPLGQLRWQLPRSRGSTPETGTICLVRTTRPRPDNAGPRRTPPRTWPGSAARYWCSAASNDSC
jgi:hypothetical protein